MDTLEWLNDQWNNPGITEQYLMQIAAEVRRVLAKKPASIKLKHFLLKFTRQTVEVQNPKLQKENSIKRAWKTWLGIFGVSDPDKLNLLENDGSLEAGLESEESDDGDR